MLDEMSTININNLINIVNLYTIILRNGKCQSSTLFTLN